MYPRVLQMCAPDVVLNLCVLPMLHVCYHVEDIAFCHGCTRATDVGERLRVRNKCASARRSVISQSDTCICFIRLSLITLYRRTSCSPTSNVPNDAVIYTYAHERGRGSSFISSHDLMNASLTCSAFLGWATVTVFSTLSCQRLYARKANFLWLK